MDPAAPMANESGTCLCARSTNAPRLPAYVFERPGYALKLGANGRLEAPLDVLLDAVGQEGNHHLSADTRRRVLPKGLLPQVNEVLSRQLRQSRDLIRNGACHGPDTFTL